MRFLVQVTLLSMGHLMYFGARENLVNWFTDGCGYPYDPKMHGLASDWVMDLVNIGFKKPEVGMLLSVDQQGCRAYAQA